MKTKTKEHLLEIIKEKASARPVELARLLNISPQALHRHLKNLVVSGHIEQSGRPPHTRYVISGAPDFEQALSWFQSESVLSPSSEICETRDIFSARLNHFVPLEKKELSHATLPLVISLVGELGNNCFDHNLGQWKDLPGCWFEFQLTQKQLWVIIADRGQGIYNSLLRVLPDITNEQAAIEIAFNKNISGRAPEQRGNGLKYVKNIILENSNRGLACHSGKGKIHFGGLGSKCATILQPIQNQNFGTITCVAWEIL